jgi:hypothetical protein
MRENGRCDGHHLLVHTSGVSDEARGRNDVTGFDERHCLHAHWKIPGPFQIVQTPLGV